MIVQNKTTLLQAIGNTPLLRFDATYVKCEFLNPSGSVKDRYAKYAIERAEAEGLLKPGDTIVEATSGNMGNALSMVAAAKGYKMLVLMPHGFSNERLLISRAYGAEVRLVGEFHIHEALALANKLGQQPGYFCPKQFENPWNVEENDSWLGSEIITQLDEADVTIDAFVQGVGTGGTLMGVGKALRSRHNPNVKLFAVEPSESPTLATGRIGHHRIEGISDGIVPAIYAHGQESVTEIISVSSDNAIDAMRRIARQFGCFVGPSSGANWIAADTIRNKYPEIHTILTLFCDEGEKYLHDYHRK